MTAAPALRLSLRPPTHFILRVHTTFMCNEKFLLFLIMNLSLASELSEKLSIYCLLREEWIITYREISTSFDIEGPLS